MTDADDVHRSGFHHQEEKVLKLLKRPYYLERLIEIVMTLRLGADTVGCASYFVWILPRNSLWPVSLIRLINWFMQCMSSGWARDEIVFSEKKTKLTC